jgi:uncharacterized membrane protein YfcA
MPLFPYRNRHVDIRQGRLLLVLAITGICGLALLPRIPHSVLELAVFFCGGLFATVFYAPLQRLRVDRRYVRILSAAASILGLAIVMD